MVRSRTLVRVLAGAMAALLLLLAGGYGFHRDEMYFILAGRHLDSGTWTSRR